VTIASIGPQFLSHARNAEEADMQAVPGQHRENVNPQDSSTSDCGRRHPVHAILSKN
jgi:hypothetical protein